VCKQVIERNKTNTSTQWPWLGEEALELAKMVQMASRPPETERGTWKQAARDIKQGAHQHAVASACLSTFLKQTRCVQSK